MITIVVPTRNEATILQANLECLLTFLRTHVTEEYSRPQTRVERCLHPEASRRPAVASGEWGAEEWRVMVADNGSTDPTRAIVRRIAAAEPRLELLEIPEAGKGRAVFTAWCEAARRQSQAASDCVFVFMDADLATGIDALPRIIAAIRNGADIAVGSRYAPGARVQRSMLRRVVSRGYQFLLRTHFGLRVSDAPCGFKAVNARVVHDIVPHIRDAGWFFDTELCIRAEHAGMRIVELPVAWHEPRRGGSLAKVLRIILHDLRAIRRLRDALRGK